MEQRELGDSGLFSSAIGFGTWEMSTTTYGHIDVDEAADAVFDALDQDHDGRLLQEDICSGLGATLVLSGV